MFDGYVADWTFNWMRVFPFFLHLLPESLASPEMASFRSHILQLLELIQIKKDTLENNGLGEILLEMKTRVECKDPDFARLGITETTVLAQALQFLSASFIGVVGGVKELFWHLVNNPEVVEMILGEAEQAQNGQKELDFEGFAKLQYLTAAVLETIRLTPSKSS